MTNIQHIVAALRAGAKYRQRCTKSTNNGRVSVWTEEWAAYLTHPDGRVETLAEFGHGPSRSWGYDDLASIGRALDIFAAEERQLAPGLQVRTKSPEWIGHIVDMSDLSAIAVQWHTDLFGRPTDKSWTACARYLFPFSGSPLQEGEQIAHGDITGTVVAIGNDGWATVDWSTGKRTEWQIRDLIRKRSADLSAVARASQSDVRDA